MRKFFYYHTLTYLLLFISFSTFGQKKYDTKATSAQLSLEGKTLSGYKASFDFGWEEVRRGWWEYAREFASPLNMKTYYKVTIPSETTDGNVDLLIYTQTTDGKGGTEFFLGLENEKYKKQALTMILDFKKGFYIDDLVEQIEGKQGKADDLSRKYRDAVMETEKQQILNQLNKLEEEIEQLRAEIKSIERLK
jgi:hypothetical protein